MNSLHHPGLLHDLHAAVAGDSFWENCLTQFAVTKASAHSLHLAVMVEPFLQQMLAGRKTVESRFSINRCAPYQRVEPGDVILLKQSGGPVVGICQVKARWFYQLDPAAWEIIKRRFTKALCADSSHFWDERENAAFATLIRVSHLRTISPVKLIKRDRRGWVVLQPVTQQQRGKAD